MTNLDVRFVESIDRFVDKTTHRLDCIAKRIGFEFDESEARGKVYDVLGIVQHLPMTQRIWVAKKLANNSKDMNLFFSLPDECEDRDSYDDA